MWTFFDFVLLAAGYAACWFSKDWIKAKLMGAQSLAASLEAKAAALKAKL